MNSTIEINMARKETQILLNKLESLETCFISKVFGFLLNRFNVDNEILQRVLIESGLVVELDSLIQ